PFDLLTRPQREALICLACGDSVGRAAALAEVTERTVRRWRNLPVFQAALAEARVDFFSACRSHVNGSIALAFEVLSAKAGSYSVHKGEQVKAATFLLGLAPNARMSARSDRRDPKSHETSGLTEK